MKEKNLGIIFLVVPLILIFGVTLFTKDYFSQFGKAYELIPLAIYAISGTIWLRWCYTHLVVNTTS